MSFESMWQELTPVGRSASTGGYFRQPFGSAEREAVVWFEEAAAARGLRVERDGFGNIKAVWDVPAVGAAGGTVLTGSHLDSVLDGGAFDGPLGVVTAMAAVDLLRERDFSPTRSIAVGVFVEEEGSRFGLGCIGSRLAVGMLDLATAETLNDREGIHLLDAMDRAGLDPSSGSRLLDDVDCFVELHVEQGRELVHRSAAIGVASRIWSQGRYRIEFAGDANHAGTTRMEDRRDPMLAYAAAALAANEEAGRAGGRATFGRVAVEPNSSNAVPSRVTAWLDARCATEDGLARLVETITARAAHRAGRDGTTATVTEESLLGAVEFDQDLAEMIARAHGWPIIATQAGHDAGILQSAGIPAGMLFVRNPTGVSHSPDEHTDTADCLAGVTALADTLALLAGRVSTPDEDDRRANGPMGQILPQVRLHDG